MSSQDPRDFEREVREAYERIRPDIRRTPLELSEPLSQLIGARVFIKWECNQVTGSFKFRGALNTLRALSSGKRSRGVVSASTGNHGLAIGHAAGLEGVDLRLFLPETTSVVKRTKIESIGVTPEFIGKSCDKTEAHARAFAKRSEKYFVSPYNDWDIVRGAATVGLEIAEELPEIEDVIVPIGGGGLIAGIAAYMKISGRDVVLSGVEPETSAFMAASIEAGRIVEIEEGETIADGVAGGIEPGSITFSLCQKYVDRFLRVKEDGIARAMAFLFEKHGRRVEAAGALPIAALQASPELFRGRNIAVVISGMNISLEKFQVITGVS